MGEMRIREIGDEFLEFAIYGKYPTEKTYSGYAILKKRFKRGSDKFTWKDFGYLFETEQDALDYLDDVMIEEDNPDDFDIRKVEYKFSKTYL